MAIELNRDYATNGGAYYDLAGTYLILGEKEQAYQVLSDMENEGLFHG